MICKNCGNEMKDGAKFCAKCGAPAVQPMPEQMPQYESQPMPQYEPQQVPMQAVYEQPQLKNEKKKKSHAKAIIAIVLVVAILAGIAAAGIFWIYPTYFMSQEDKLKKKLGKLTDKEIVEFYFDDFNGDGTNEAFAVTGKKGKNDKFTKGEIWFVSDNSDKRLKNNVNGKLNGLLEEKKNKYISVEVEDKEKDGGSASYIYGVKEKDKYYEPEVSGKYQGVHQNDDGKIVDINGTVIGINIDEKEPDNDDNGGGSGKPEKKPAANSLLEATDEEIKSLAQKNIYWVNAGFFDSEICSPDEALGIAFDIIGGIAYEYKDILDKKYGKNECIVTNDMSAGDDYVKGAADPLGLYEVYRKIPAEKGKWISENILNVKAEDMSGEKEVNDYLYYKDNYIYHETIFAGDYCPELEYVSHRKLSDGKYAVILKQNGYDATMSGDEFELTVGLKELDGERIWSYYKIRIVNAKQDIPAEAVEFNGSKYMRIDDYGTSWTYAERYCESLGGHLVTITSQGEQDFVKDLASKGKQKLYWIGAVEKSGKWTWITGENFAFTNWGKDEPNDYDINEKYGEMYGVDYNEKFVGDWNDAGNNGAKYAAEIYDIANTGFICEWDTDIF